jgi:aarF domain-containing kinase
MWANDNLGSDALDRIVQFDKVALPAIIDYKVTEARCEKLPKLLPQLFSEVPEDEQLRRYALLHEKHKQSLFDIFMELGGFYYKSGQKIASNTGGVVPKVYSDRFQPFLNDIPPRPEAAVREVIEAELGRPMGEVFSSFTWAPVGCASIGQAHRATLTTGERVVVKVQNPEAERTFRGDVLALRVLVDTFFPQASPAFDEIQKQFATEFDYRGECANAQEVRANLIKAGFTNVLVPAVHEELCSRRLMVMEEIYPSIPLHTALDQQAEQLARQRGVSKARFLEIEEQRVTEEQREAARKGRLVRQLSSATYDRYIQLQKGKRSLLRPLKLAYNGTLGRLFGVKLDVEESVLVPINAARLVDDLLRVMGHEVLVDGCFNADPHPGNILYLAKTEQLGLIDYGQVKRLTELERLNCAKAVLLVAASFEHDPRSNPKADLQAHARAKAAVAAHMHHQGMKTEKMLASTAYELAMVYMGRMDAAWIYPRNFLQWTDHIQAEDAQGDLAGLEYFVMVNMASLMVRGLGEMLQQSRNLAVCWKPYAERALREKGTLTEVEAEIASWKRKS